MSRIVLIDDNEMVREAIARMLETGGHEVIAAATGAQALHALATAAVDLVITDLFLDGEDGRDVIVAIHRLHPELPIIAMSGTDEDELVTALSLGAIEVMNKPIRRRALLEAVARVSSGARH
jgi:two-component system KDP operon response regulator KdpE